MANRSTPSDKVLVDPLFQIPPGAEDQFAFTREGTDMAENYELVDDVEVDSEDLQSSDFEYVEDGYEEAGAETLAIPENFSVISQVLRRAPGGQQVIDIVVEVEDIEGAVNYEIQVTKV